MITYNISKSLSEALGIDFVENISLSDQQLNTIPKDEIISFPSVIPSFPIMKGEDHPMYGKKHRLESKLKMSLARKGRTFRPLSEEHKYKLRKKRPNAGKNIAEANALNWIVTNKTTGEEIKIRNLNAFCRERGLAPGNLYKTVTGEIKQHKGYSIRHA